MPVICLYGNLVIRSKCRQDIEDSSTVITNIVYEDRVLWVSLRNMS